MDVAAIAIECDYFRARRKDSLYQFQGIIAVFEFTFDQDEGSTTVESDGSERDPSESGRAKKQRYPRRNDREIRTHSIIPNATDARYLNRWNSQSNLAVMAARKVVVSD